jgi:hypothetical protein
MYNTDLLLETSVITQCLEFVLAFYVTIRTPLTKQYH